MSDLMDSVSNADPTGILSATTAAIKLVGTVARVSPSIVRGVNNVRGMNASNGTYIPAPAVPQSGPPGAQNVTAAVVDPERERRAYETVNFVLRTLGTRLDNAGLISAPALSKALTAATAHIEVKLFSVEANRLFQSLASRLNDPVLVNSVFTSIYLIGALTAELSNSLPNYKPSYVPLGPRMVQQLFRASIGEDAFRENLTANLDAFKTLVSTAGLLRPTDIGYSIFPGFPNLSPCRYSNRSFNEVRKNKNIYERLVKHFEIHGFPQPLPGRDVGPIRDWRFLSGDANSRAFEVEKADKYIGEGFGRVLYWLTCSADRMPPGMAVVAYFDQHIELIKWMGTRMGYRVIHAATDLDMRGIHQQLIPNIRAVFNTWVLVMPSETALANRRASTVQWNQQQQHLGHPGQRPMQTPGPIHPPQAQLQGQQGKVPTQPLAQNHPPISQMQQPPRPNPQAQANASLQGQHQVLHNNQPSSGPPPAQNTQIGAQAHGSWQPQNGPLPNSGPTHPNIGPLRPHSNSLQLSTGPTQQLQTQSLQPHQSPNAMTLQSTQSVGGSNLTSNTAAPVPHFSAGTPTSTSNLSMISHISGPMDHMFQPIPEVPNIAELSGMHETTPIHTDLAHSPSSSSQTTTALNSTPPLSPTSSPTISPTPLSPAASVNSSTTTSSYGFPSKRSNTVIRRKAPPPPRKTLARALYSFEPEEDDDEGLAFTEGDILEIVKKSAALDEDGWCKAKIKDTAKIGKVPLEYIEEIASPAPVTKPHPPAAAHHRPSIDSLNLNAPAADGYPAGEIAHSFGSVSVSDASSLVNSPNYIGPSPTNSSANTPGHVGFITHGVTSSSVVNSPASTGHTPGLGTSSIAATHPTSISEVPAATASDHHATNTTLPPIGRPPLQVNLTQGVDPHSTSNAQNSSTNPVTSNNLNFSPSIPASSSSYPANNSSPLAHSQPPIPAGQQPHLSNMPNSHTLDVSPPITTGSSSVVLAGPKPLAQSTAQTQPGQLAQSPNTDVSHSFNASQPLNIGSASGSTTDAKPSAQSQPSTQSRPQVPPSSTIVSHTLNLSPSVAVSGPLTATDSTKPSKQSRPSIQSGQQANSSGTKPTFNPSIAVSASVPSGSAKPLVQPQPAAQPGKQRPPGVTNTSNTSNTSNSLNFSPSISVGTFPSATSGGKPPIQSSNAAQSRPQSRPPMQSGGQMQSGTQARARPPLTNASGGNSFTFNLNAGSNTGTGRARPSGYPTHSGGTSYGNGGYTSQNSAAANNNYGYQNAPAMPPSTAYGSGMGYNAAPDPYAYPGSVPPYSGNQYYSSSNNMDNSTNMTNIDLSSVSMPTNLDDTMFSDGTDSNSASMLTPFSNLSPLGSPPTDGTSGLDTFDSLGATGTDPSASMTNAFAGLGSFTPPLLDNSDGTGADGIDPTSSALSPFADMASPPDNSSTTGLSTFDGTSPLAGLVPDPTAATDSSATPSTTLDEQDTSASYTDASGGQLDYSGQDTNATYTDGSGNATSYAEQDSSTTYTDGSGNTSSYAEQDTSASYMDNSGGCMDQDTGGYEDDWTEYD